MVTVVTVKMNMTVCQSPACFTFYLKKSSSVYDRGFSWSCSDHSAQDNNLTDGCDSATCETPKGTLESNDKSHHDKRVKQHHQPCSAIVTVQYNNRLSALMQSICVF